MAEGQRLYAIGEVVAICALIFMGVFMGRFSTLIFPAAGSEPEQTVIKGVLKSVEDWKGENYWWRDLKFEDGQQTKVLWGTVPVFIGQYQEIICQYDMGKKPYMVRNYCPAHEAACAEHR